MSRSSIRRRVEQAVAGELPPRHRRQVVEHLRADEGGRAAYDRVVEAYRVLEGQPLASFEMDLVEQWLLDDPERQETPETTRGIGWAQFLSVFAAVAAAILLVVGPLRPHPDDGLRAKGGRSSALSIDALCGTASSSLRPVADGCALEGTLSFAYRVDASRGGVLTLFGLDAQGNINYYAPTPVDPRAVLVQPGGWRPVPQSINLPVNHQVGSSRLFALLCPRAPSVDQIDALAVLLQQLPAARPGDPPWHQRLAGRAPLSSLCGPTTCDSAELAFRIYEDPS